MMSAQMLSSSNPMTEAVPLLGNDMRDLEAKAAAVAASSGGGEVKQNISFVRGETQSKAVEESEAQQVLFLVLEHLLVKTERVPVVLMYNDCLKSELVWISDS